MAGSTADSPAPRRAAGAARTLTQQLLNADESRYAPWFDRRPCRDFIAETGLPEPRSEAWKYTNVRRWYDAALPVPALARKTSTRPAPALPAWKGGATLIRAPRGVEVVDFSNDRAGELFEACQGGAFDLGEQPLAAVNGLLFGAGAVIHVPRGVRVAAPVHVERLGAAYQRLLVVVEAGASLTLIEEPGSYSHRVVEGSVGEGASLRHLRRQAAARNRECGIVGVRVAANAEYTLAQSSMGADLRRNDVLVSLAGEAARVAISSVWRLGGRLHLDNQITVRHLVRGGFSRQIYRGVVADHARVILHGGIHIAPNAQATDAALSTRNLLASATAEVYAKPELEIYANDVKCSHGATIGTLDDAAVYYLRSRGIDQATARALLLRGFLREAVEDHEAANSLGILA